MRKVWTRVATIILILVVSISFSACSLFTTNLDKKYSPDTMVATAAHDDISVSRQELYYGYLEWGYQYASSYSSQDELLEYITNALLNTKVLEKESIEKYGALRSAEKALALKQAYQSLDTTLRTYINEALEIEEQDETDESDKDEKTEVDEAYQPTVLVSYENGNRVFTFDLSKYADEDGLGLLDENDYDFYVPDVPGVASAKNVRQAISKIIRNLQSLETGFTQLKAPKRDYLSDSVYFKTLTASERAVLNREIDRMVKSNQTSILSERLNTAFNLGFNTLAGDDAKLAWDAYLTRSRDFAKWCDLINGNQVDNENNLPAYYGCGRVVATSIANKAIQYYLEKTTNAIQNQKNFAADDLESSLMSSGLADVYYIPDEVAGNLFTVSHILVGFTDEQKAEYKQIENNATNDPSYDKENQLNQLYAETKSHDVSAYDILLELQTALDHADNLTEKYQIFREYINKYNSDPGMQNLEQLNSSSKPQYEYLMSGTAANNKMVEPFTNASIDLFNQGIKGEISGLVWTEYGAHIIMYTRNVRDFIYTGAKGMEKTSIKNLDQNYGDFLFTSLTSYGQRTLFDTLVDAYFLNLRDYTIYRTNKINQYKNEHEITIITSEFKDFLKK